MRNRKNLSFFILFLLYIIIVIPGHKYLGENVFYASLPMIFGASVIYNYAVGFAVVILNIPATFLLLYIVGIPFAEAVVRLNPFIILLQCVSVVIPSLVKVYNEKKDEFKIREFHKRMNRLAEDIEKEKQEKEKYLNENKELALIIERYKEMLNEQRMTDPMTGVFSRSEISRRMQRHIAIEDDVVYIFLRINAVEKINKESGIFKGDEYIKKTADRIRELSKETGRIFGTAFLIIQNSSGLDDIVNVLSSEFGSSADIFIVYPKKDEGVEEIFNRWFEYDR